MPPGIPTLTSTDCFKAPTTPTVCHLFDTGSALDCAVDPLPAQTFSYADPYDLSLGDSKAYHKGYILDNISVVYSQQTVGQQYAINGVHFDWCMPDKSGGISCDSEREEMHYRTYMGQREWAPVFDPLHWVGQLYFHTLADLEKQGDFTRFNDPHVAKIVAFKFVADPTYIGRLQFTFTTGQIYNFQAPEVPDTDLDLTDLTLTYTFSAQQQIVAPYGYFDASRDALSFLGFTTYDTTDTLCDCNNSILSNSGGNPLPITGLQVPMFGSTDIVADLGNVQNTVDTKVGNIPKFCGDYTNSIKVTGSAHNNLPINQQWQKACESDCLQSPHTNQMYHIATVEPANIVLNGQILSYDISIGFKEFIAITPLVSQIQVDVQPCVAQFDPSPISFGQQDPVRVIIGKDEITQIQVPEFKTIDTRCMYEKEVEAWILRAENPSNTLLTVPDTIPENMYFFFHQKPAPDLTDEVSLFEIHSKLPSEQILSLANTNTTVYFQATMEQYGGAKIKSQTITLFVEYVMLDEQPDYASLFDKQPTFRSDRREWTVTQNSTLNITLDPYDFEGDPFDYKVDLSETKFFANYTTNGWLKQIYIFFAPTLQTVPKMYPIWITLSNKTDSRIHLKQKFKIYVEPLPKKTITFDRDDGFLKNDFSGNRVEFTQFIVSDISPKGLVQVDFSERLKEPLEEDGYPSFGETPREYLNVQYVANYDGEFADQDFSYDFVSWDPDGNYCLIQLTFSNPLIVSIDVQLDYIVINFDKEYFLRPWTPRKVTEVSTSYKDRVKQQTSSSINTNQNSINDNSQPPNDPENEENTNNSEEARRLQEKIESRWLQTVTTSKRKDRKIASVKQYLPTMLSEDANLEQMESVNKNWVEALKTLAVTTLSLSLIIEIPTYQLWLITDTFQMYILFSYMELRLPGSYTFQMNPFVWLNSWDWYENQSFYEIIFMPFIGEVRNTDRGLLKQGQERYEAFRGKNVIKNSVTLYLSLLSIGLVTALMNFVGSTCEPRCCGVCRSFIGWCRRKINYNLFLRFLIESYLAISLASLSGIQNLVSKNAAEKIAAVISTFQIVYCFYMPVQFYRFLRKNRSKLRTPEQKGMFNAIYLNLNYYKLPSLSMLTLKMYRKLFFVVVALFITFNNVAQMTILMYCQIGMLLYFILIKPMDGNIGNGLQLICEYAIYSGTIIGMLFTDYVYSPESRYKLGTFFVSPLITALVLVILTLSFTIAFKFKFAVEGFFEAQKQKKIREQLIKEGKIVIVKQLTAQEKAKIAFKERMARKKRKQKRDMKRAMRARRRGEIQEEQSESELQTPHYSDDLQNIRNNFDAIYAREDKIAQLQKEMEVETPKSKIGLKEVFDNFDDNAEIRVGNNSNNTTNQFQGGLDQRFSSKNVQISKDVKPNKGFAKAIDMGPLPDINEIQNQHRKGIAHLFSPDHAKENLRLKNEHGSSSIDNSRHISASRSNSNSLSQLNSTSSANQNQLPKQNHHSDHNQDKRVKKQPKKAVLPLFVGQERDEEEWDFDQVSISQLDEQLSRLSRQNPTGKIIPVPQIVVQNEVKRVGSSQIGRNDRRNPRKPIIISPRNHLNQDLKTKTGDEFMTRTPKEGQLVTRADPDFLDLEFQPIKIKDSNGFDKKKNDHKKDQKMDNDFL